LLSYKCWCYRCDDYIELEDNDVPVNDPDLQPLRTCIKVLKLITLRTLREYSSFNEESESRSECDDANVWDGGYVCV